MSFPGMMQGDNENIKVNLVFAPCSQLNRSIVVFGLVSNMALYNTILLHAEILCLAFLAYDWVTACWDSLSILLHSGIACLASVACDWVTACWDSLSVLSMSG